MKEAAEGFVNVLHNIVVKQNAKTGSKSRKKQRPCKWLRDHTSPIDFGLKYDGHPIHCNKNEEVLRSFRIRNYWIDRMRNRDYDDHFSGRETFYFTGDPFRKNPYTLLMIDIDCHNRGTLRGAIEFAEYLAATLFPNLYFEVSTNGNGVHGYSIPWRVWQRESTGKSRSTRRYCLTICRYVSIYFLKTPLGGWMIERI